MTVDEAVASICADARFSPKGQHADYIRCILSQVVATFMEADSKAVVVCHAEIDNLTAQLATAEKRSSWQPIETAPKDGRLLLLHGVDVHNEYRKPPFIGRWAGDYEGDVGRYWQCRTPGLSAEIAPTHWQYLPEPPL